MNEMQMSERIGNIDDRLIDQAEQFGKGGRGAAGFRRGKTRRVFRRLLAVAAAAALMTGGFVLGAFALNEEPEMIEKAPASRCFCLTAGRAGISVNRAQERSPFIRNRCTKKTRQGCFSLSRR